MSPNMNKTIKNIYLLFVADQLSTLGDVVCALVTMFWIYDLTNSFSKSIFMVSISYFVSFFASFWIGSIVDNYSNKIVVMFLDAFHSILYLILGVIAFYKMQNISFIFCVYFLANLTGQLSHSASQSWRFSFFDMNAERQIVTLSTISSVLNLLYYSLGGIFAGVIGFTGTFFFNSATFLVAMIIKMSVPDKCIKEKINFKNILRPAFVLDDFNHCWRFLKNKAPVLIFLSIAISFFNFFFTPLGEIFPLLLKTKFNLGQSFLGQLIVAQILGNLLGGLILKSSHHRKTHLIFLLVFFFAALVAIWTPFIKSFYCFFIVMFFCGLITITINIHFSLLLKAFAQEHFAKLNLIISNLSTILIPVGLSLVSVLSNSYSLTTAYYFNGCCLLFISIIFFVVLILKKNGFYFIRIPFLPMEKYRIHNED